jgi:hypothetical protein
MSNSNSPKSYPFLDSLNLDVQVRNTLAQLVYRTEIGSDEVFVTPLGKNYDPNSILKEWDKIFESHSEDMNEPLRDLEQSNRSKFGPRSIAIPWKDREEMVTSYFGEGPSLDIKRLQARNSLVNGRLRPLSLNNAMKYLKNDTNSGLPFFTRKGKVKEKVLASFDSLLGREDPCIMFTRTQESKKTRAVWGFPIADTLNEMKFYVPLLDIQRKQTWRAALSGPDTVDAAITTLIKRSMLQQHKLVSIDFSSYDATLKKDIQTASFDYIKACFQPTYNNDLSYIERRFRTIGLVTPGGILTGDHGVPSGSTFTNEVDSIAQWLCAESSSLDLEAYQIQGDDGAYGTSDPEGLKDHFRSFGLEVNDEKSYIADNYLIYLQNLHHIDYQVDGKVCGIYPTYRALNRLIYQERFTDFMDYDIEGSDYYSIRAISILENCKHHPLYEELVKFVVKKDKYGLEPSQQSISNYVKMIQDKAGAEGIIKHQYGDVVSGIKSFETYKLVKSMH